MAVTATIPIGTADNFPLGQCTYWADKRYHELTGKYIPWGGDARMWLQGAISNQWATSATPPTNIPSIVVLQPQVQGAGGQGHVAAVESVDSSGCAITSNLNWGTTAEQQRTIRTVRFCPGPGVSFVYYPTQGAVTTRPTSPTTQTGNTAGSTSSWITQLQGEGIKVGLFLIGLILMGFGLYLLFSKQIDAGVKKSVGTMEKVTLA